MKKIYECLLLTLILLSMAIPVVGVLFLPQKLFKIATIIEVIVIILMSTIVLIYVLIDTAKTKNKK